MEKHIQFFFSFCHHSENILVSLRRTEVFIPLYFASCTEDDLSDFFEDLRDDGGTGSNHSFVMYDKDSTLIAICLNSIDEIGAKDGVQIDSIH